MWVALLFGVFDLAACTRGGDATCIDHAPTPRIAAMAWGLSDDPPESSADDATHVFVHVPFLENVDDALRLQGNAMLTWPYRTEAGEKGRIRVLTVSLNAVVLHHGYLSSHLVNANFRINEVECSSRSVESIYLAVDLSTLPLDGQEQFTDSVLAHPNRHYVVHLRPHGDLTWGEIAKVDEIDLTVESRNDSSSNATNPDQAVHGQPRDGMPSTPTRAPRRRTHRR